MFKIADIFTDHMVLQREQNIKVFGKCDEQGEIKVEINGNSATAKPIDGKWIAELPPMCAGGPYELSITFNDTKEVISDVLIGDVWIASGQSNMEFPLIFEARGLREAKYAYNPDVRLYTCSRSTYPGHTKKVWAFEKVSADAVPWSVCDERSALHFSAIGYYVAKLVQEQTGIPIGVISANVGGTPIDTFVPEEAFENEHYKPAMEAYNKIKVPDEEAGAYYDEWYKDYLKSIEDFGETKENQIRQMGIAATVIKGRSYVAAPLKMCKYHSCAPSVLYNMFIRDQIMPMAVKGVLWYQGESSRFDRNYADKFRILTEYWREAFQNKDMPFYTVEIAPHNYREAVCHIAYLRAEQWRASDMDENVHIVSTQDVGDKFDIHPYSKIEVSERLANQILNYTYGIEKYCESPSYSSHEIRGKEVWIKLRNAEGFFGDDISDNLLICGEDDRYHKASFKIDGDYLVVWKEGIDKPKNVRYCFADWYGRGGFFNKAGLPLAPFATDISK